MIVFLVIYSLERGGKEVLSVYSDRERAEARAEFLRKGIKEGNFVTRPGDKVEVEHWDVRSE